MLLLLVVAVIIRNIDKISVETEAEKKRSKIIDANVSVAEIWW